MGRKNNRMNSTQDKNFEKFIKTFMTEQKQTNNRSSNIQKKTYVTHKENNVDDNKYIDSRNERNKERLEYAIRQLDLLKIQYRVVDEHSTLIHCKRKSDNYVIKYYASNGFIVGYPDFRGIRSLLKLLNQDV